MAKLAHEIYSFDEFRLDLTRGALFRGADELKLRPKSFDVLKYLTENPGRLISKDELIESIWEGMAVTDDSLVQCLKDIRRALDDTQQQIIKTVPRRGYIFDKEVSEKGAVIHTEETSGVVETDDGRLDEFVAPDRLSKAKTVFGREKETIAIKGLLRRDDVRLVTLTGTGGTGKTRLAQAVLEGCRHEFDDGAFFVDLAAVNDPDLVASAIANTLGVKESSGKTLVENLINFLRDKRLLLVLDNFEQIIPAADLLPKFTGALPKLKILVTSRVPLHLPDEYELSVPPLAVPPADQGLTIDDLKNYSAVKLFIARAQGAKPTFIFHKENAFAAAQICARLDGLPLAIELAAARVKLLSPTAILGRLEKSLNLLTSRRPGVPDRQRTMRGVIEWSYDLLDEDEKGLFNSLAVFAGGFTVEAAESIIQIQGDGGRRNESSVLDLTESLIDKNLLVANERSDGSSRFRMLEIVREYALEFFERSAEQQKVRQAHAIHFLTLAEDTEPHLSVAPSAKCLQLLEEEHDNVRAALDWSLEYDTKLAARLTSALRYFWSRQNHLIEARKWFELALAKGGSDIPAPVRFKLLNGNGMFARQQGDYEKAREMHEMGLAEGSAANDQSQIASSSRGLGMVAVKQGDFEIARKYLDDALAIDRTLEDNFNIALTLSMLGDLARLEGASSEARSHFEASLVITRQLDDKWFLTSNLNNLGFVACDLGDYKAAGAYFAEALAIVREFGNKIIISYTIDGFCALAVERGDAERAARLAGAAENLRTSMGSEIEPAERRFRDEYIAKIKANMDEAAFTQAYGTGGKLKLEDTVALCLPKRKK